MTKRTQDPLRGSGGDWEPDSFEAFPERRTRKPSRSIGSGGIILMAATAVAVLLAVTLGIKVSLAGFVVAPSEPLAADVAPPPVDSGDEVIVETEPLDISTATPGSLGDAEQSEEAVTLTVNALVDASTEIAQRADGGTDGIDNIATGFVAGELESLALERSQLGFTQTGAAKIVSVTPYAIDLSATPPALTLEVCIDTSDIDVLDSNGTSLKDRLYDPGVPTLHLYGAQFLDGLWKIATHSIPDNASCS